MPNFENLHKNKKLAFLDGLLCGIATAYMASQLYNDRRETKALERRAEEAIKNKTNIRN